MSTTPRITAGEEVPSLGSTPWKDFQINYCHSSRSKGSANGNGSFPSITSNRKVNKPHVFRKWGWANVLLITAWRALVTSNHSGFQKVEPWRWWQWIELEMNHGVSGRTIRHRVTCWIVHVNGWCAEWKSSWRLSIWDDHPQVFPAIGGRRYT